MYNPYLKLSRIAETKLEIMEKNMKCGGCGSKAKMARSTIERKRGKN